MAPGRRLALHQQALLVWADRGQPAFERYIETGSFGDDAGGDALPYDPQLVKQIVTSGMLSTAD